jgi:hypothetical protein
MPETRLGALSPDPYSPSTRVHTPHASRVRTPDIEPQTRALANLNGALANLNVRSPIQSAL